MYLYSVRNLLSVLINNRCTGFITLPMAKVPCYSPTLPLTYNRLSSIILELNDSVEFTEYLPHVFQSIRLTYGVLEDYAV